MARARAALFALMLLISLGILARNAVTRRQAAGRAEAPLLAAQADSLARAGIGTFGPGMHPPGPPAAIGPSVARPILERALRQYREALGANPNTPLLMRRIGILTGAVYGPQAAWEWFRSHPDPQPALQALWEAAYGPTPLSAPALDAALAATRQQAFSWYIELTRVQLLQKAGRGADAARALAQLQSRLRPGVIRAVFFGIGVFLVVLAGLGLWVLLGVTWRSMPALRASIVRTDHELPFAALSPRELAEPLILWLFLFETVGSGLQRLVLQMGLSAASTPRATYLALEFALQVFAAACGAALLAAHLRRHPARQSPVPPPISQDVVWGGVTYVAALPLVVGAALLAAGLLRFFPKTPTPPNPGATLALSVHGPLEWALLVLVIAVGAPITEELFFRGVLYTLLRKRAGAPASIFLSAAAFALVHPQLPLGFLPILALGATFAGIVEMRRSLVPSVTAHALNNLAALALAGLLRTP